MRVTIGLEQIEKYHALFQGKRIGLITNFTGVLPDMTKDCVDVFVDAGYQVSKIFTPEHGLYGAAAGEKVEDCVHPHYGIPVISLYGEHRKPTDEDVAELDVLVYDIQDVGLRYYTYIYTMCYCLDKAAEKGISFVVLDRPNPLGDTVEGPVMSKEYHSFVGDYELPMRYGLTAGEMARYYLAYTGKSADLTIVPLSGYERSMIFPQTGLLWNVPSPSLPTYESTLCYMGGCLYEATNISEGRGCSKPFQMYGAPFVDMDKLYRDLTEELIEDGVVFRRRSFIPGFSKHQGKVCYGLEFFPVKENCDFLTVSLVMMKALARRYPEQMEFYSLEEDAPYSRLSILSGNGLAERFIREEISLGEMQEAWREEAKTFLQIKKDICIYK